MASGARSAQDMRKKNAARPSPGPQTAYQTDILNFAAQQLLSVPSADAVPAGFVQVKMPWAPPFEDAQYYWNPKSGECKWNLEVGGAIGRQWQDTILGPSTAMAFRIH